MARRRSGKKIDFLHWTFGSGQSLAQSAGTAADTIAAAQHLPETIMRTRGQITSYLDTAQSGGQLVSMGVGLVLVPEGTGSTVLWSPITDSEAPWLWVNYFALGYEEMVTDVVDVPIITAYRAEIDSKAMRRIVNMELQVVFENVTIGSAAGVNTLVQVRVLTGT